MQLELLWSRSQLQNYWSSKNRSRRSFCRTACGERRRSRRGCCKIQQDPDPPPPRHHRAKMLWCLQNQPARFPRRPKAQQHLTCPRWAEASLRGTISSSLIKARRKRRPPALLVCQPPRWPPWRSWKPKGWGWQRKIPTLWRGKGGTVLKSAPGWRKTSPHQKVRPHHGFILHYLDVHWSKRSGDIAKTHQLRIVHSLPVQNLPVPMKKGRFRRGGESSSSTCSQKSSRKSSTLNLATGLCYRRYEHCTF